MGRSLKVVLLKQTNMKLLLVLAAAGLSCAAPAFAYSIGHHPLVYTHHPAVTYTLPTAYHPVYHTAYGYPYGGLLPIAAPAAEAAEEPAVEEARKKREAEGGFGGHLFSGFRKLIKETSSTIADSAKARDSARDRARATANKEYRHANRGPSQGSILG